MNKAFLFGGAILLMALAVGCGGSSSPEDAVMKDMVSTANRMADILEMEAPPDAAVTEFKTLSKKGDGLKAKFDSWPKAKQEEMMKKYKSEMVAAGNRVEAAMKKNANPSAFK
jgi:hypothetical protein